ncbi:hypothetical protein NP233_g3281 [Leucocoprinus birnbaumii]|uniref:CHAT domain-containing protein n=1 Tax=Leucocoprinus birnbaumii TaxID=56174 RepID=A0AAD5VZG3_9AGAR|nr:hypothetical protein NP233_g3281 [Leucocoprinus birnbaumii]
MDDKAELEQLARDMARFKANLFMDPSVDLTEPGSLILAHRQSIKGYQDLNSSLEQGSEYGSLALTLAVVLVSRFVTCQKESDDLTEAKELEDTILRYNHNIHSENHDDHYHWQHYVSLIARGDLIIEFQILEARLARLQTHQAQPLDLSHQTEAFALLHTRSPITTSESNATGSSLLSNAENSLVGSTDTDFSIPFPSFAQLGSSQLRSTSLPSTSNSETSSMDSWLTVLLNANQETEICDYAFCCQVLAHCYFSRYQLEKAVSDLEDAVEYSMTAYHLFANDPHFNPIAIPMTQAILLEYLNVYDAQSPHISRIDLCETLRVLAGLFSQHTGPPPHAWSDSSYQTETPMVPHANLPIAALEPDTPVLSPLSNATNSSVAAVDTGHSLNPIPARPGCSHLSFSFPSTILRSKTCTMESCMTALLNANDATEIRDYAIYCKILAQMYFARYCRTKDTSALEEAAEYSVTAYQLVTGIADVSRNLILPTTVTVLFKYVDVSIAQLPCLPSINVTEIMETVGAIRDHFSESTTPHTDSPIPYIPESNAPLLSPLSDATSSWVPVTDANHDLLPAQDRLSSSPLSFTSPPPIPNGGTSMMISCKTALLNANDETEIRDYAIWCQVLAQFYFSRYRRAKYASDLEEAAVYSVTAYQLVADIADVTLGTLITIETAAILLQYVGAYHTKSEFHSLPNIAALETFEALMGHFSDPPPYVWRFYLGEFFSRLHCRTKTLLHADTAITQYEKAFESKPPTSGPMEWLQKAHHNLGVLLFNRYLLSSDSGDLDAAINNLSLAEAQISCPCITGLLGMAFLHRHRRVPHGLAMAYEDIQRAILCYMRGTQFVGPEHARLSIRSRHHLGLVLIESYRKYGDKTDLSRGIQHLEELLHYRNWEESAPDFNPRDAWLLLASAYKLRSTERDEELRLQCIRAVSEEDRRRPRDSLEVEIATDYMPNSQDEWRRRAEVSFQIPWIQFMMARSWGTMALGKEDAECLEAFKLMASLLLEVIVIGNKVEDKYERLWDVGLFGGPAAVAAIKFATANLAVEWLELSMSVTLRQIYQLRLNADDLAIKHPDLFKTLKRLSEELRQLSGEPIRATGGLSALVGQTNGHRLRSVYQAHIEEIRGKPGMENFLRPLPFRRLVEAARYGPVILLSCDHITKRTHAFIILDPSVEEPITLPLPRASLQDMLMLSAVLSQVLNSLGIRHRSPEDDMVKQLQRAGRVSSERKIEFEVLLNEMWTRIVKPVFDKLEEKGILSGRVWWCPSMPFTEFPLHAAPPVDCPYISSYTYGIEVLLNARARSRDTTSEQSLRQQFSLVGIGKYPGRPYLALPSVTREIQTLTDLVEGHSRITLHKIENDEASVGAVLSALKSSQFVHLACHGARDLQQSLDSSLVLTDGNLQLRRILAEDLKSAEFAFLSACQTAIGESKISNESLHLAGGFIAAGFKGVIGTLWSIADEDAPGVVKDVYEAMEIEGGLDITLAAGGLDRAVKRMRKSGVPAHRWAPFIHVGV